MTQELTETAASHPALVGVDWLSAHLADPSVVVLDGSWYLPSAGRDPAAEFAQARIPGARFFDIEAISDRDSAYPHMLPTADAFEDAVSALGVSTDTHVIVYDGAGVFSAPRVWWMFRVFGHERISVLNGGLPAWRKADQTLEEAAPATPDPGAFRATKRLDLVADFDQMAAVIRDSAQLILDARAAPRFRGEAAEPRPGLASGHMPGAVNLPFAKLIDDSGSMHSPAVLEQVFAALPGEKDIVTSCGSGISACVISLALATTGRSSRVYDGSWTEWASRGGEVATGAAEK